MKFEIKHRWSGEILFSIEAENWRFAVEAAIKAKANLSEADLSWANLSWANLSEANLSEANLSWANLSEADLSKANLSWANLSWADLSKANLSWADLSKADLSKADLSKANLSEADLSPIKSDFFAVLSSAPKEVEGLRAAIVEGRIDGSTYEGECACLVGTIANVAQKSYEDLPRLRPNSRRAIERFFMAIKKGDTPQNSQASKLALEWLDEWLNAMKEAFAVKS